MAEFMCTVDFIYSKKDIPEVVQKAMEFYFMQGRSKIVELVNPHFEEWNAAYTKEVNGDDDPEYLAYIDAKQQAIMDEYNYKLALKENPITFYSDGGDIAGRFYWFDDTEVTMHMVINLLDQ